MSLYRKAPLNPQRMSQKRSNFSKLKFLSSFLYIHLCAFGLATFIYDQKTKQIIFSRKLWILNGIAAIFIAITCIFNIWVLFIHSDFLLRSKISLVGVLCYSVGYAALVSMLFSLWKEAEKLANALNEVLKLIKDIGKLTNSSDLFEMGLIHLIIYKFIVSFVRFIMYIWHAVETTQEDSPFVFYVWILHLLEFKTIQIAANWNFLTSTIQLQLYDKVSSNFRSFLKANFLEPCDLNKDLKPSKMHVCCQISDQLDVYAEILSRMYRISTELMRYFGILVFASISFGYTNATVDAYYMYFIYTSPGKVFPADTSYLIRKYVLIFADLFGNITMICVASATMSRARQIERDYQAYVGFRKCDDRLEKSVSTLNYPDVFCKSTNIR